MIAKIVGPAGGYRGDIVRSKVLESGMIGLGDGEEIASVRILTGRSKNTSRVYCVLDTPNGTGVGWAGGSGYHKASAAMQEAITDAGYKLYGDPYGDTDDLDDESHPTFIGGCGTRSMVTALEAIVLEAQDDFSVRVVEF